MVAPRPARAATAAARRDGSHRQPDALAYLATARGHPASCPGRHPSPPATGGATSDSPPPPPSRPYQPYVRPRGTELGVTMQGGAAGGWGSERAHRKRITHTPADVPRVVSIPTHPRPHSIHLAPAHPPTPPAPPLPLSCGEKTARQEVEGRSGAAGAAQPAAEAWHCRLIWGRPSPPANRHSQPARLYEKKQRGHQLRLVERHPRIKRGWKGERRRTPSRFPPRGVDRHAPTPQDDNGPGGGEYAPRRPSMAGRAVARGIRRGHPFGPPPQRRARRGANGRPSCQGPPLGHTRDRDARAHVPHRQTHRQEGGAGGREGAVCAGAGRRAAVPRGGADQPWMAWQARRGLLSLGATTLAWQPHDCPLPPPARPAPRPCKNGGGRVASRSHPARPIGCRRRGRGQPRGTAARRARADGPPPGRGSRAHSRPTGVVAPTGARRASSRGGGRQQQAGPPPRGNAPARRRPAGRAPAACGDARGAAVWRCVGGTGRSAAAARTSLAVAVRRTVKIQSVPTAVKYIVKWSIHMCTPISATAVPASATAHLRVRGGASPARRLLRHTARPPRRSSTAPSRARAPPQAARRA